MPPSPAQLSAQAELLNLLSVPALLVSGQWVGFANHAATHLLGSHIMGQDVRIALRNPDALAAIAKANGRMVKISGLSVPGSVWGLTCNVLQDESKLVTLEDLSVQVSVARAHADFVANASHELRTPLAAILGYVETLEDPKAGEDTATRTRFLSIIQREAKRMLALVEDLMSLSRIEAVKHQEPEGSVDLVALVRQTAGEVGPDARIEFESNADTAVVTGDRGQLAQVLRNLIDNALKYGAPDKPVNVELETTKTGWVSINVRDEGEGIDPEHLPRLTERFYRADASRSRQAGGTGLGLSIVKHIVERHRGRFDITSRKGQGTTAFLMLPLEAEAAVTKL